MFDISSTFINTTGLMLDIIGVISLFFFGLPPDVNRHGNSHLILEASGPDNDDEKQKAKRYGRFSWLGLIALVLGFILQIWSNYV